MSLHFVDTKPEERCVWLLVTHTPKGDHAIGLRESHHFSGWRGNCLLSFLLLGSCTVS